MRPESRQPALTEGQRAIVREVVDRVIPGAEVWLFGSRTTGRARPFSDLDLLITRPGRLTWAQRAALSDGFEASELPFRVDAVEADGLVSRRLSASTRWSENISSAAQAAPSCSARWGA